jgi:ABC-type uncharacterized transport system substrate-binding protein
MAMMKRIWSLAFALMSASPIAAHPHVFIDTGFELIFDDTNQLTHVRMTWKYDALYSLLVTEDMGLDADYDGKLTEAEQAVLTGFDMNWIEGFNGDLEVLSGAEIIPLSGPSEVTATFDDGQITTTHLREVLTPLTGSEPFVVKAYDATFYSAYDVTLPLIITGTDSCRTQVKMPVMGADLVALLEELGKVDLDADPEDVGLPNIGAQLAQDVIVTCAES